MPSDSAASLALAMPSATTPATVAATAATAGTVRVRWRAASRTAYRIASGSTRASFERPTTTTGTSRIMPSTATMAAIAMAYSPPPVALAPYAETAMPPPSRSTPSTGERNEGRLSPRRPASTETTSWRDASQAGTTAASSAETRPKPAMPSRWGHGTS